jgi:hypothetical protein
MVAALAVLIAGCASEPPAEPERSPTGSAVPWSRDLRYNPVDAALCESMDLAGILRDADLTIERPRFTGTPTEGGVDEPSYWVASCEFDTKSDDLPYVYSGDVGVVVTKNPSLAYDAYGREVDSVEQQVADEVDGAGRWGNLTPIAAWWAEGIYAEYERGLDIISIVYRVYHENMHMRASFNVSYDPGQLEKEAVGAIGHDLAEALIEEAIGFVPCEALGDAPTPTHCDDTG